VIPIAWIIHTAERVGGMAAASTTRDRVRIILGTAAPCSGMRLRRTALAVAFCAGSELSMNNPG